MGIYYAQLKHINNIVNYVVSYLKLDSNKIKNESIVIIPTIGFNRNTNFILKLNSKIILTCIRCQSNESIGLIEGENSESGVYYFTLSLTKFKVGDVLVFVYNKELIVYKIEKNFMITQNFINLNMINISYYVFYFGLRDQIY